jgi:membrane-associated phospholipid phosphatase
MITRISQIISWVFLPLFMPLYALMVTLYTPSSEKILSNASLYELPNELKTQLLFLFIIFGTIAPGISFILMYRRGLITTIEMDNRNERSTPLFIVLSYCLILFLLFCFKAPNLVLPRYIYALPLTGTIISVLFIVINLRTKISLHAAGTGILTGYFCAFAVQQLHFNYFLILSALMISGLVLSARLILNKHTPFQVYLGWALGFVVAFVCNLYYPFGLI